MKGLIQGFVTSIAGISGNLIAAYIVADVWSNVFSPVRIWGTLTAIAIAIGLLRMLESETLFIWNRRWHEWWYAREILSDKRVSRWSGRFSVLEFLRRQRPLLRTEAIKHGDYTSVPLIDALIQDVLARDGDAKRVLVVGEPGSGKTTGLERTTWELAFQRRRLLFGHSRLPVLVRLDRLSGTSVEGFVAKTLETSAKNRSGRILSRHLPELVHSGRIVLLFDALDEALAGPAGEDIKRQIHDMAENAAHLRVPIVITSRTREEPGFPENVYEIQDLSDLAVREFISRFRPGDPVEAVWETLLNNHLLVPRGLGRNPFWLEILLLEKGSFEGSREELIDRAVDRLLRERLDVRSKFGTGVERGLGREFRKTHPWRLPPNLTIDEGQRTSRSAFAWLAFRMSVRGVTSLREDQAKEEIQSWLQTSPVTLGWSPDDLLHLGQDAQILNYPYDESTGFRHRLLQETLTAWGLINEPAIKDSWTQQIEEHADDVAWWQTLILLAETGIGMESYMAPILHEPTPKRLTLAAVLTSHKHNALSESDEYAHSIQRRFYESLSNGVRDDHKRAMDALQRLAGEAVIALISDMLSVAGTGAHVFDAAIELLTVLDVKLLKALSKVVISKYFAERLSTEHAPSLAAAIPALDRATRDLLLARVTVKVAAAILEHLSPEVSALSLAIMMPRKAAVVLQTMEPKAAGALLDHSDAQVAAVVLPTINSEAAAAILSTMVPETARKLLARLPPETGGAVLATVPALSGAVMLAAMVPETAGQIVAAMPAAAAGPVVAAMPWEVACAILTSDMVPETAGQIVAAMPAAAAGPVVAAMTPSASGLILATMEPVAAGEVLASCALKTARTILTTMPRRAVGNILVQMDQRMSDVVLTFVAPPVAGDILAFMAPEKAGVIFQRLEPAAAGMILERMKRTAAGAILERVTPAVSEGILGKVSAGADGKILAAMTPGAAVKIVEMMTPEVVGAIVVEMASVAAGHILERMGAESAGEILASITPGVATAIFATMRTKDVGAIVVTMRPKSAGRILTVMGPEKAIPILEGMSAQTVESILEHVDPTFGTLLAVKTAQNAERPERKEDLGDGDD